MSEPFFTSARLRLGNLVITPAALQQLTPEEVLRAIQRHQAGDWGDLDEHDRQENERSLKEGARLLSVYHSARRVKFCVITEADRSITTVLLPGDY